MTSTTETTKVRTIIKSHKDLEVYKKAFEVSMQIFEITKRFPRDERYSLVDQVRRSSRSVCSNIAEAWRKRRYEAAFVAKLSDSEAEAAETQVWLQFSLSCGYINSETESQLKDQYEHVIGMLVKIMKQSGDWTL
ncbi:four helix bundle protein [Elusimicrobiota bacterium]